MQNSLDIEQAELLFDKIIQIDSISDLSQKMQLLYLSLKQKTEPVDISKYSLLTPTDCQQLLSLGENLRSQMLIYIVTDLAKQHNLTTFQTDVINGSIEIKTKTFGRWKQKQYQLEISKNTFEIVRKKKNQKNQFYSLTVEPFRSERYRFTLQAMKNGKGYYKSLTCGSKDLKKFNSLLDLLKRMFYFYPDPKLTTAFEQKQSLKEKQSLSMDVLNVREQVQSANPKLNRSQKEEIYFAQSVQQQKQEDVFFPTLHTEQDDTLRKNSSIDSEHISDNRGEEKKEEQINQINHIRSFSESTSNPSNISNLPLSKFNRDSEKSQRDSKTQDKYIQDISSQQIVDYQKNLENQVQQGAVFEVKDTQRLKTRIEQPQVTDQEDEFHDVEVMSNDVEEVMQFPQVYLKILEEGKLSEDYLNSKNGEFKEVYSQGNFQILRAKDNPLQFRCQTIIEDCEQEQVFQAFAEVELMQKWNGSINNEETRLVNLLQSETCSIIQERRKPYGKYFLPRDLVYLRKSFQKNEKYYILDKSIEHEECPEVFRVIRGDINYQIIKIERLEEQFIQRVKVSMEVEMTNGGFSSQEEDAEKSLVYLMEIKNIHNFMEFYKTLGPLQTPLLNALQIKKQKIIANLQLKQEQQAGQESRSPGNDKKVFVQENPETLSIIKQIPDFGSYSPNNSTPKIIENRAGINDIKEQQNEDDQDDDDLVIPIHDDYYVSTEVITSNCQDISEVQREQIMKQIQMVEQNKYFGNCITHRFILEPFDVKYELMTESEGGHFLFKNDWEREIKYGGLKFINIKKTQAQKKVLKYLLKKIGTNLLQGKSVIGISLPVDIFETRSNLERFAYSFIYAPYYLEEAAKISSPEEQMKYTISFGFSSILMFLSLEKPFNPILGETYQGLINGCPVFCEQIAHHPPTCAIQFYGRGYTVDGHMESQVLLHANSVLGRNLGYIRVTYHNTGVVQYYIQVPGTLTGTAFGDRTFNYNGKGFCIDMENNLIWDCTFNPAKQSFFSKKETLQDYFVGGIYKVRPQAIQKYKKDGYGKYNGIDLTKDVVQKLNTTTGFWNQYLQIDDVQVWNLTMFPYLLSNHPNPLPSDSNYRLDILYWKLRDWDNSQRTKEVLEIMQRNDRKLKEKSKSKRK